MRFRPVLEELDARALPSCACAEPPPGGCELHASPIQPDQFIEIDYAPTGGIPAGKVVRMAVVLQDQAGARFALPVNVSGDWSPTQARDAFYDALTAEGFVCLKVGADKLDVFSLKVNGTTTSYVVTGLHTLLDAGGVPNAGAYLPTVKELKYTQETIPPDGGE